MKLSVVVGTWNRYQQIRKCLESIFSQTRSAVKVFVTDAGSTDDTVPYLKSMASKRLVPILLGKKIGQAAAYNEVFKRVKTPYVCWLSDDNVVINHGLDLSLNIMEGDPRIGMIGLKTKDVQGPFLEAPYIGGISSIGILNVNQGMLPTHVLREVGYFSEEFRDYGIDPDLTAKVLFSNYKIVYTKKITLLHYRNWPSDKTSAQFQILDEKQKEYHGLYNRKYAQYLDASRDIDKIKDAIFKIPVLRVLFRKAKKIGITRDCYNILTGRYIKLYDPLLCLGKQYHLVQHCRSHKVIT